MINYTFFKSPATVNSNVQKYLQNFQKLNLYSRKTENVQISLNASVHKSMPNFFAKIVQSAYFFVRLFKEL